MAEKESERYRREMDDYYERENFRRRAQFFPGLTGVGLEQLNIELPVNKLSKTPECRKTGDSSKETAFT